MNVKSKNCFAFCHMITTFAFKIAHDWLRYEFIIIMKRFVSRWFSGPFVKYFNCCCHSFCIGIHILSVLNRTQEQYRKLQEKQKQMEQQQRGGSSKKEMSPPSPPSRADRIQQLRSEHQKRHRERHGQYPSDRQEELYEQKLQQYEKQVQCFLTQ